VSDDEIKMVAHEAARQKIKIESHLVSAAKNCMGHENLSTSELISVGGTFITR